MKNSRDVVHAEQRQHDQTPGAQLHAGHQATQREEADDAAGDCGPTRERAHYIRKIGVFAGIGLAMIGLSFVAVMAYFGPAMFGGPVTIPSPQARMVNRLAHMNLRWSSYVGRGLYPIWAILAGRWLGRTDR